MPTSSPISIVLILSERKWVKEEEKKREKRRGKKKEEKKRESKIIYIYIYIL